MNALMRKYSQNLASNLTRLLMQHKLSIDKLATALNIPSMTIRRLVSGQTLDPRVSTLRLIATYFNVSVDSLVGDYFDNVVLDAVTKSSVDELNVDNGFGQFNVPVISWDSASEFIGGEISSS